ncbi:Poly(ADP-ribose) glycohydrolase 1 [Morus notabilis]|uniref:poly(ADP-ribose) glycohydrolase n=1 Tax=Morus notabilis TaxID=981085 RepID=W9RGD8_9ROSA|nr:Poly(ADP-ribose) glycohydrolase 1 [Morus notabilis]
MEEREDLKSILPYLPVVLRSSRLFWPSQVVEILKSLAVGPDRSRVLSGELLFAAISNLRHALSVSSEPFAPFAPQGYALFFDELMSKEKSKKWFEQVFPMLANLVLRFPSLLETHYQNADGFINRGGVVAKTGLCLLNSQEDGVVLLNQELVGALLGCSFFCLFPLATRGDKHLPTINFDHLFASLYGSHNQNQESKINCIIHYFERICANIPMGSVSFERKVLALGHRPLCISYPDAKFWGTSTVPLCQFEAHSSGLIEDQSKGALEVDFANKYLGGGALHRGCVQEEIRFMVNPELIAGMLFLPALADNESIEVVGAERYASSFRFSGDYVDKKEMDSLGRRKTRIIAIDALCCPGMRQYRMKSLIRETNKAFCGFIDQSKYHQYERLFLKNGLSENQHDQDGKDPDCTKRNSHGVNEANSPLVEAYGGEFVNRAMKDSQQKGCQSLVNEDNMGIATGNWGCGAFGGDPELKTIIQWLAASQALRPFVSYYTFGERALRNIDLVTEWILSHEWTVGDLWNMLVEYSSQLLNGETSVGFFTWLIPTLPSRDS